MAQTAKQRNGNLDLIRALAIVMVLMIHSASGSIQQPPACPGWWGALVWAAPVYPAVPLFLMCSGALLLSRDITPKRVFTHNMPRILCAMFGWAFVYQLCHLPGLGGFTAENLLLAVRSTLTLNHEFHFYYLHVLVLVYAFLPVVRVFVRAASRRELEYALAFWFVTGILFPLIQVFPPFDQVGPLVAWWKMPMSYSAVGYALLGYYLRQYGGSISRKWYAAALGTGLALTFGGTAAMSLHSGALVEKFLEGMSPGPMLMAFGWFGLLLGLRELPAAVSAVSSRLARASFCIYLSHIIFLRIFFRLGFGPEFPTASAVLLVPLTAALLLLCCWLLWEVLHRVPVVDQYFI